MERQRVVVREWDACKWNYGEVALISQDLGYDFGNEWFRQDGRQDHWRRFKELKFQRTEKIPIYMIEIPRIEIRNSIDERGGA